MSPRQLSARAVCRGLTLARTIADLAGSDVTGPAQLAEAIQHWSGRQSKLNRQKQAVPPLLVPLAAR